MSAQTKNGIPVKSLIAALCGGVAVAFSTMALMGWATGRLWLASLQAGRIPMAPSTALLFALYGTAMALSLPAVPDRLRRWGLLGASLAGFCIGSSLLLLSILGLETDLEFLGFRITPEIGNSPIGHMSPVTAAMFIMVAVAMFTWSHANNSSRVRVVSSVAASGLVVAASLILMLSYLAGIPFFYSSTLTPPALSTSVSFAALGVGLLTLSIPTLLSTAEKGQASKPARVLMAVYIALIACTITGGFAYYRSYEVEYEQQVERQLTAVADLKASDLSHWRQDLLSDGAYLYNNQFLISMVKQYLKEPEDTVSWMHVASMLGQVKSSRGYERVSLISSQGTELISVPDSLGPIIDDQSIYPVLVDATAGVSLVDFHRHADGRVYLAVLVPVTDDVLSRPIATVVLQINPEKRVYPMLSSWPGDSKTAETLLVRREGDEVVFLNELRFQKGTALNLRRPLALTSLPAARAASGFEGIMRGKDYRGVPVIAATRTVPNSPWSLVSRIDAAEVYAPLTRMALLVIVTIAVLLSGTGIAARSIWKQQQMRFYRERSELADALEESLGLNKSILQDSPHPIVVRGNDLAISYVNPAFEELTGYRSDELLGRTDVFPFWDDNGSTPDGESIDSLFTQNPHKREHRFYSRQGQQFWIESTSTAMSGNNASARYISNWTDITERKNAEAELRDSQRFLEVANRHSNIDPLLQDFVVLLKESIGCDAVGIRALDAKGNIPYKAYTGFTDHFYLMESPLSTKLDTCLCINVVTGKTNPSLSYYTDAGSFYMNGTTKFLATLSDEEKNETRNVCNAEGYESVALVPIRTASRIVGLIHVADRKEDMVPLKVVRLLERVAPTLGVGLQRALAIEELQNSERRLKQAQSAAKIGDWEYEIDTCQITWSDEMYRLYERDRSIGPPSRDEDSSYYTPEEDSRLRDTAKTTIETGKSAEYDFAAELPSGRRVTFHGTAHAVIDSSGKAVRLFGTTEDVTERKKTEEALSLERENYRNSLDMSPLGIQIVDTKAKTVYANPALLRMIGYDSLDEWNASTLQERLDHESASFIAGVRETIGRGQAVPDYEREVTMICKDGQRKQVFLHRKQLTWNGEKVSQVMYEDITDRRKMQERLMLTDRLASIGELAAGVAHEMNNPLTSVIGFSELLLEKDMPESVRDDVLIIAREAKRTAEVVRNMLTFARRHPITKQPVDLADLLKNVLQLRAYENRVNSISVVSSFASDTPAIYGDYFQLQQVFLNLFINAEYFMKAAHGRGTMTVKTQRDANYVTVSISDDGPGIPPENLNHVFDPFFTTKGVGKGTGLGLSICHGIITEHGGKIHAESELGKGATFVIELPRDEGEVK